MTLLLDGNCVAWSCCNELVSLAIMNKKGNKCALRERLSAVYFGLTV